MLVDFLSGVVGRGWEVLIFGRYDFREVQTFGRCMRARLQDRELQTAPSGVTNASANLTELTLIADLGEL